MVPGEEAGLCLCGMRAVEAHGLEVDRLSVFLKQRLEQQALRPVATRGHVPVQDQLAPLDLLDGILVVHKVVLGDKRHYPAWLHAELPEIGAVARQRGPVDLEAANLLCAGESRVIHHVQGIGHLQLHWPVILITNHEDIRVAFQ